MSAELDRGDPSGNLLSSAAPMEPVCAVSTKGFDQAQGSAIISLATYREQPDFRWTENKPCEDCGGSGILYPNTGPSGLHSPCDECGGVRFELIKALDELVPGGIR